MRYSRQRECILKYVKSVRTHPTAEDIWTAVRNEIPNISLGTVYRNLKQLELAGQILTIESTADKLNYDGCVDPHQHFMCSGCNKVFDLTLSSHLSECEKQGFIVTKENTVLYGTCPKCNADRDGCKKVIYNGRKLK